MENGFQERGRKDWKERERNREKVEWWKLLNLIIPVFPLIQSIYPHPFHNFVYKLETGMCLFFLPIKTQTGPHIPGSAQRWVYFKTRTLFPLHSFIQGKDTCPWMCFHSDTQCGVLDMRMFVNQITTDEMCGEREPSIVLLTTSFQYGLCVAFVCV